MKSAHKATLVPFKTPAFSPEPSPESHPLGGFMFVQGGLTLNLTKMPLFYSISYFILGELGALFGGTSPPKPPVSASLCAKYPHPLMPCAVTYRHAEF